MVNERKSIERVLQQATENVGRCSDNLAAAVLVGDARSAHASAADAHAWGHVMKVAQSMLDKLGK